jgi:hypothetical protein
MQKPKTTNNIKSQLSTSNCAPTRLNQESACTDTLFPTHKTKKRKVFHLFHRKAHPSDQCHAHTKARNQRKDRRLDERRQQGEEIDHFDYVFGEPQPPTEDTAHAHTCDLAGGRAEHYKETWNQSIRTRTKKNEKNVKTLNISNPSLQPQEQ